MSMKQKPAWVIRHWTGQFYNDTIRATRRDTIETFQACYGVSEKKWRYFSRHRINRAIKVRLVEVK